MNAVGLNFVSGFCKNIKQHNCFYTRIIRNEDKSAY